MPDYEIKPNRTAFVSYRFFWSVLFSFIFFSIVFAILAGLFGVPVYVAAGVFVLWVVFRYYSLHVRYQKTRYIFQANRIIIKSGGIFSDSEVELVIRNITNVIMALPFIQYKLFRTGHIFIQSAGTSGAEISLNSLDKPQLMYEYIEGIMKRNGFKLTKKKLVQKEQPATIGVFFEVFKKVATGVIGALFVIVWLAGLGGFLTKYFSNVWWLILAGVLITIFFIFLRSLFTFLDLKNRVYNVYEDTITYSEGFLSKNYSFIPVENLADSTVTQTLIDQMFGLYDVKISCQGTKQEILFKNMKNGPKLEKNIDQLIARSESLIGKEPKKVAKGKITTAAKKSVLKRDTSYTGQFSMDGKKTIIPIMMLLPFIIVGGLTLPATVAANAAWLFFAWLFYLVAQIIKMSATKYYVKASSMEEQYDFITTKHKEFTNDKIMAVVFKENFMDKWFRTCSINFWSIGSSVDIKFANIKKTNNLYPSILAKSGVSPQDKLMQMDSHFSFAQMLKAQLPITILAVLLVAGTALASALVHVAFSFIIGLIILLYIIQVVYFTIFYQRSKMTFFKEYIYFQRGIFFREFYYILYNNIKDITTVKYPFSTRGSIRFNIAGERMVQQGKRQLEVSNSMKINYIDDIDNKDELLDLLFYQRPTSKKLREMQHNIHSFSPQPVLVAKEALANSVTGLLIFSIIIFPFMVLLPLTLPLTIWVISVRRFIIQPYRVVSRSGILYIKQTSIIFPKVDHINFHQGMFNKMFKNGSITVNTSGSSKPELILKNMPNYKEFYDRVKERY